MVVSGDMTRPNTVKAEFDQDLDVTPYGGAALVEQTLRSMGLFDMLKYNLPPRSPNCDYKTEDVFYAHLASCLLGGQGIGAINQIRSDDIVCRIFGLEKGAPSDSTVYRALCNLAGLKIPKFNEVYSERGETQTRLKIGGEERVMPKNKRIVPDEPEWATDESREVLHKFLHKMAIRCASAISHKLIKLHGWNVIFGDGTLLEVEGDCFDAARKDYNGNKSLLDMTVMLGPIVISQDLLPGNEPEASHLLDLMKRSRKTIKQIVGKNAKILKLLDAAFFENKVVRDANCHGEHFIICANKISKYLRKLALTQPAEVWVNTGADENRGWKSSQVCVFVHTPSGWEKPVNIICRRWVNEGDLDGFYHYSFLGANIEPKDIPLSLEEYGYCQAIWMLYATKQARENHYKTPLRDFGLHHPPSCRLGVNQVFYALMFAISNIAMVMRFRVMPQEKRGMQFWNIRQTFIHIAGYITYHARTLTVRLSGGNVPMWLQSLWKQAYAEAGRL
jgi:DDE family transposase